MFLSFWFYVGLLVNVNVANSEPQMNLLHRIIGIKIPLDGELKLSSKNKAGGTMNWDQESISETKGNIAMPFSIHVFNYNRC